MIKKGRGVFRACSASAIVHGLHAWLVLAWLLRSSVWPLNAFERLMLLTLISWLFTLIVANSPSMQVENSKPFVKNFSSSILK